VHIDDPWQRFEHDVPTELFGLGARHDFSWYLEGESDLEIATADELVEWLRTCTYESDSALFHEADFWQHPCTFERLRTGDCEDYALWSWRRLIELGYDAEFVAGRTRSTDAADPWKTGHAWVLYRDDDRTYLLDAAGKRSGPCPAPLDSVRRGYLPEVSVDGRLKRYVYGGYYLLQEGWR
jgi:hypothetical protein